MEGASSRSAAKPVDIKKLVNEIFATKGLPGVKNFAKEFADGSNSIKISFKLLNYSPFPGALQHSI